MEETGMKIGEHYYVIDKTADTCWRQVAADVREHGQAVEGRNGCTLEILHVTAQVLDPRQALIRGRNGNVAYAIAETIWNLAGGNRTPYLEFYNSAIGDYLGDGTGSTDAAYGYRFGTRPRLSKNAEAALRDWNEPRLDQMVAAYRALLLAPESRQIEMQSWDAERDFPTPEPKREVPCVIGRQCILRDGRLHWVERMRSNDLMFGTPNDIVYATVAQEILAGWLGVELGIYTHQATSMHVYERHWDELHGIEQIGGPYPENVTDLRLPYAAWVTIWSDVVDAALALTAHSAPTMLADIYTRTVTLPYGYRQWIAVLAAEALRRRGAVTEAYQMIEHAGDYWASGWLQWADSRKSGKRKAA
jgi:thymidylate synthase